MLTPNASRRETGHAPVFGAVRQLPRHPRRPALACPPAGHPEVCSERVWEAILKRLLQKDYKFDAGFFGSLNEFSRKVAYFFRASLQGTACYDGAAEALRHLHDAGV